MSVPREVRDLIKNRLMLANRSTPRPRPLEACEIPPTCSRKLESQEPQSNLAQHSKPFF